MKRASPEENEKMTARLFAALELMEFNRELMRQNIRRSLPHAAPERIDAELRRWLIDQPSRFVLSSDKDG